MTEIQIPLIAGASEIAGRYPAWLCDVWGVIHDGVAAFPEAVDALSRFREGGGHVVLVTNAPRPAASVASQLDGLGVSRAAYDAIITSGDVTRDLLSHVGDRPLHHLGPDRDLPLFEGLGIERGPFDSAEVILCSGLYDDTGETPADYVEMLGPAADRGATMICANPDLIVQRGDQIVFCAGALAAEYEKLGGEVLYAGKPHGPVYDLCFRRLAEIAGRELGLSEVLAVGDGPKTDILGAQNAGIDALYVANGIHRDDIIGADGKPDASRLAGLFAKDKHPPVAAIFGLSW